jgi:alpha-beta hydrolase superfamily lysophospholipase
MEGASELPALREVVLDVVTEVPLVQRTVVVNAVVCGVIGAAFGVVDGNAPLWLIGGVLFGAVVGAFADLAFRSLRRHHTLHRFRMLGLVLVEALLVIYVAVPSYGAYSTVHPPRIPVSASPAELGPDWESVTLTTGDGVRLAGWYVPSRNRAAIVVVHGHGRNRTQLIDHVLELTEHGYGVLASDLRAHGESSGDRFAPGGDSDLDVLAAVRYLHSRDDVDPDRIGALGLSAGAHAVICAAAHTNTIEALWLDGVGLGRTADVLNPLLPEARPLTALLPASWMRDRMIEAFSRSGTRAPIKEQVALIAPRPVLLIASGHDRMEAAIARRYAANAGPGAKLWVLPEADHVGGIRVHPEEYAQRMIAFFDDHLVDVGRPSR